MRGDGPSITLARDYLGLRGGERLKNPLQDFY